MNNKKTPASIPKRISAGAQILQLQQIIKVSVETFKL